MPDITNVEQLADALALMDADEVWTRLSYQDQAVRLLEHFNLTPADIEFEQVGRQAFANGDMAAPALNARVREAIGDRPVGDYRTLRIMQAFSRGYDAARDEAAVAALADVVDHRRCIENGAHLASSRHTRNECTGIDDRPTAEEQLAADEATGLVEARTRRLLAGSDAKLAKLEAQPRKTAGDREEIMRESIRNSALRDALGLDD